MRTLPPVVENERDLPPLGRLAAEAQERDWLEFKGTMAAPDMQDFAVHTASFANRLGGVILVGADLTDGMLSYPGIPLDYAAKLKESFECAAKEWCHPVADVRPVIVPRRGATTVLLAANVTAHVGSIIGVNTRRGNEQGVRNPEAWLFPYRVGSHTKYAPPSELPMFFDVQSRAAALRLLRIPTDDWVCLYTSPPEPTVVPRNEGFFLDPGGPLPCDVAEAKLKGVHLDRNAVAFGISAKGGESTYPDTFIPLRDVTDVWRGREEWCVRVRGRVRLEGHYEPVVD